MLYPDVGVVDYKVGNKLEIKKIKCTKISANKWV